MRDDRIMAMRLAMGLAMHSATGEERREQVKGRRGEKREE
jgi:hypothetical protein